MNISPVRQPSALVPIAMSVAAIATILIHIALFGTARQPDEGAAAHIWQLLMAGQLPVIAYYAIKWLPRAPGKALQVLEVQVFAALTSIFPIFWFGW
jgi:hypothetical protein